MDRSVRLLVLGAWVLTAACARGVESTDTYPSLSFTVTLTSPAGMDYDLYVLEGDGSGPDCADVPTKATGTPESYSDSWVTRPSSTTARGSRSRYGT